MDILNKIERFFANISKQLSERPVLTFFLFGLVIASIGFLPHTGLIRWGTMGIFAYIIIFSVVAMGLNLLLGFSGLISLGTAGFVGAGALGLGVFMNMGIPFEIAAVLVLIISGLLGALIGLFSLKVEGIYLAIATLFVGEILRQIYTQVEIFGGQAIRIGSVRFLGFIELSMINQMQRSFLFLIITGFMVVMMVVMHNIVKSKTGRALMAMSRSQHAAQAMGISLLKYRLTAFVLATLFATFGGVMYGLYNQNVPTTAWTLDLSLFVIAMVIVGGLKSIYGTFLGVFIIYGIPNLWLKNYFGDISYIFSGILIILVIIFYPHGFVYIWYDLKKQYNRLKAYLSQKQVTQDE